MKLPWYGEYSFSFAHQPGPSPQVLPLVWPAFASDSPACPVRPTQNILHWGSGVTYLVYVAKSYNLGWANCLWKSVILLLKPPCVIFYWPFTFFSVLVVIKQLQKLSFKFLRSLSWAIWTNLICYNKFGKSHLSLLLFQALYRLRYNLLHWQDSYHILEVFSPVLMTFFKKQSENLLKNMMRI